MTVVVGCFLHAGDALPPFFSSSTLFVVCVFVHAPQLPRPRRLCGVCACVTKTLQLTMFCRPCLFTPEHKKNMRHPCGVRPQKTRTTRPTNRPRARARRQNCTAATTKLITPAQTSSPRRSCSSAGPSAAGRRQTRGPGGRRTPCSAPRCAA